ENTGSTKDTGSTIRKPYHLITLPRRVRDLPLPHVELIDMGKEIKSGRTGVHLFSARLEHLLKTQVDAGHQAILMLNRRGYSNFVHCPSCQHVVECKYCDTTMTYHRSVPSHIQSGTFAKGLHSGQMHCHYCLAV